VAQELSQSLSDERLDPQPAGTRTMRDRACDAHRGVNLRSGHSALTLRPARLGRSEARLAGADAVGYPSPQGSRTMKGPIFVRLALAWFVAALPGCWGDREPCADLEKGERLEIEILGPHEKLDAGEELCSRDWGLGEAAVIEGTVVDFRGEDECDSGVLDAPGVGDWEWTLNMDYRIIGMYTLESWYTVSNGSCDGLLSIKLRGPDSSRCTPSAATCVMFAKLDPAIDPADLCPARCSTHLDVYLRRL
jgi:hypothetical protein